jgi:hypothetical protein
VLPVDDLLETLDGVLHLHVNAGLAGEGLRDVERLREEALDLPGTRTVSLSSSESSSMPRIAMMSWRSL